MEHELVESKTSKAGKEQDKQAPDKEQRTAIFPVAGELLFRQPQAHDQHLY
jgi:hypothetical protein